MLPMPALDAVVGFGRSGYGFGSRSGLLVQHPLSQLMVVLLMSVLDPEQLQDRVNRQDLLLPLKMELVGMLVQMESEL